MGFKSSHLANLRFFVPNPFSESKKWTKINVHFSESQKTFGKRVVCDHIEFLSSGHKKNNSIFVTLFFFIWMRFYLGDFLYYLYNGRKDSKCHPSKSQYV